MPVCDDIWYVLTHMSPATGKKPKNEAFLMLFFSGMHRTCVFEDSCHLFELAQTKTIIDFAHRARTIWSSRTYTFANLSACCSNSTAYCYQVITQVDQIEHLIVVKISHQFMNTLKYESAKTIYAPQIESVIRIGFRSSSRTLKDPVDLIMFLTFDCNRSIWTHYKLAKLCTLPLVDVFDVTVLSSLKVDIGNRTIF